MDLGLGNRTVLVTGGAGRIGSEDCRVFAAEGAEVIVLDVDREGAETVAAEIDAETGSARAVGCDLTDREAVASTIEALREEVASTIEALREETGGIDVLVNNAAMVDARSRVAEYDDEIWEQDARLKISKKGRRRLDGKGPFEGEVLPLEQ